MVCDFGFAIGLHTREVAAWRWCVFFPLGAALRRGLVTPIGKGGFPEALENFPVLGNGSKQQGWFLVENGDLDGLEPTADRSLPLGILVDDTRLKEMLVADWKPEDVW